MASFRELFDEDERNELLLAMQARQNHYRAALKRSMNTETAGNASTHERLQQDIQRCEEIIRTICSETC